MPMSDKPRRWIRRSALFLLTTIAALVCLAAIDRLRNENEEYSVYSAYFSKEILAYDLNQGAEMPVQTVIVDTTQMDGIPRLWARNVATNELGFGSLHVSTRISFIFRNLYHTRVFPKFTVPNRASVVTVAETELRSSVDSSELARDSGYFILSGIGFNPSRTQAIFHIKHMCGGLCGGEWYVLMEKVNGTWQVRGEHYTWMS
jgi:hypothetical protein